jgi:hypothetical protein
MPMTGRARVVLVVALPLLAAGGAVAAWYLSREHAVPGGFLEAASPVARTQPTAAETERFLPLDRGRFNFPAPYNTEAYRVTVADDCAGTDCVEPAGYSYWPNINYHAGSNFLRVFVSLRDKGGPTLFTLDKTTGHVIRNGPIFESNRTLSHSRAEGWYWSLTDADLLYAYDGPRLVRVNVATRAETVVLDLSRRPDLYTTTARVWSVFSSADGLTHAGRVRAEAGDIGCFLYQASTDTYRFWRGVAGDCFVDKSGRFLLLSDFIDDRNGPDMRIIDLSTGKEEILLDEHGAPGHLDVGWGFLLAADNWTGTSRLWRLGLPWNAPGNGTVVYRESSGIANAFISFTNAVSESVKPISKQHACEVGLTAKTPTPPVVQDREIVCYLLDGSLRTLIVAPTLTVMEAPGGGHPYSTLPKGNVDVTGEYFFWTTNMGSPRLDAFVVRVPVHVLHSSSQTAQR